jgi:hypothetical protein
MTRTWADHSPMIISLLVIKNIRSAIVIKFDCPEMSTMLLKENSEWNS